VTPLAHIGREADATRRCHSATVSYDADMKSLTSCLMTSLIAGLLACAPVSARTAPASPTPPAADVASPSAPFASVRGSRVAYPVAPGERPRLVYLTSALSEEERMAFAAAAPNVVVIEGVTRTTAIKHAAEAHAIDAHLCTPEFIEAAPNLVWIQSRSAGVDQYVGWEALRSNDRIVLTNMRAAHGPAIADHAMAMLLSLTRNLREHAAEQAQARWTREPAGPEPIALEGRTMLVVGLGGIGMEIAQRAEAFGMRVLATRRTSAEKPAFVEKVGSPGDLHSLLPEADVVAICVPLTDETRGLFDAKALGAMKRGAILINIARGGVVETDALLDALRSGQLGGACLDVTDPEPLPADHPLWKEPRVLITPHVAAHAGVTEQRLLALRTENLRRFAAGDALLNVVDIEAGY